MRAMWIQASECVCPNSYRKDLATVRGCCEMTAESARFEPLVQWVAWYPEEKEAPDLKKFVLVFCEHDRHQAYSLRH